MNPLIIGISTLNTTIRAVNLDEALIGIIVSQSTLPTLKRNHEMIDTKSRTVIMKIDSILPKQKCKRKLRLFFH